MWRRRRRLRQDKVDHANKALSDLNAKLTLLSDLIAAQPGQIGAAVAQAEKNARLPKPPPTDEPA